MPLKQTSLTLDNGRLLINADFKLKDELKNTVPARRWDVTRKVWVAPATPFVYEHIKKLQQNITTSNDETACWIDNAEISISDVQKQFQIETQIKPWEHQLGAYDFVRQRMASILYMHMGTGKTKVIIDVVGNEGQNLVLVLCPLPVIEAWRKQIKLHGMHGLEFFPLDGTGSERKAKQLRGLLARHRRPPMIVVVNYESAWRKNLADILLDSQNRWDMVVLDEVHKIKSPSGKASRFAAELRLNTNKIVGMTGTLMPNNPLDLYGICRCIDVGLFGSSYTRFRARYAVMGGYADKQIMGYQNQDELADKLARITYRVNKDVLNLPPVTVSDRYFYLAPTTMKLYEQMEDEYLITLGDGTEVSAVNVLAKRLKLRQLCSGFIYDENRDPIGVSKEKESVLRDYLEDIGDEPIVVFFKFTAEAENIRAVCAELGLLMSELSGHKKELEEWQDGHSQVIAVQISTGSLGIDLTRAALNFYYSLDWNLGDYLQSRDRSDRPGQTRHITVTHCIAANTVEDDVVDALTNKQEVTEVVHKRMRERIEHKKGTVSSRQIENTVPFQHTGTNVPKEQT